MLPSLRPARPTHRPGHFPAGSHHPSPIPLGVVARLHDTELVGQLLAHVRDALVVLDIDADRILHWNPAAETLFGFTSREAVGQPIEMLMPPAVASLHRQRIVHYRRTGDADSLLDSRPLTAPALARDGTELHVELSVAPLDVDGQGPTRSAPGRGAQPARCALLTFRDVDCDEPSDRAAVAGTQTESAPSQLQRRVERYSRLLDDGTRELAASLARTRRAAARLARVSATASDRPDQAERVALLARVVEARTREAQVRLDRLADASAIAAGTFQIDAERSNLVPLIGRLVSSMRDRARAHRLNFAAPQGLTAMCDADRVTAALENIVERAIRRNPRGCWIDVDLRRPLAGLAEIEVRDYGRRLSSRERERLENPLAADSAWSIIRQVVEMQHGTLAVDFPEEGGVRVSLRLPTHRGGRARRAGPVT